MGTRGDNEVAGKARRIAVRCALPWALALLCAVCASALARPAGRAGDVKRAVSFGSGHVKGKVTSAASGKPIERVEVCAEVPGVSYCTRTAASGEYNVGGLPGGEYDVQFAAREQNFVSQYYNGQGSRAQANPVSVTEGTTVSGVNAALQVGGIVEGKVTSGATGEGLAGILVCATPIGLPSELFGECATSKESGDYTIERLETAEYTIQFWPQQDYVAQFYDDQATAAQANPVKVSAGQIAAGIDAAMREGGEITGTVTGPHGAREEGVEVCAIAVGKEPWQGQCTHTDAAGRYDIVALQGGEYRVVFYGAHGLLTQYYQGRATLAEAEAVKVALGSPTTGIDAALQQGGAISGRVTNALTSAPIEYVEACAQTAQGGRACAGTNAAGEYTIEGLTAGSYAISFQPWSQNYLFEYYGGAQYESEATRVAVAAAATVTGVDAALEPGGEITGTVRDQGTGKPIEDAQVCASDHRPFFSSWPQCASSGTGGHYAITQLSSGDYSVEFTAPGFVAQYYREAEAAGEAEQLTVTEGAVFSEVDAALQPGASIAGKVTSASTGEPLAEVQACATSASEEGSGRCARTGASGEYTIAGLPTGGYTVSFSGQSYPVQYYADTFSSKEAARVSATSGHTTSSVNDALRGGGTISGSVNSASTGAPLEGITACISPSRGPSSCAHSGAGGQYAISGLAPGLYTVVFEPSAGYLQASSSHKVAVSAEATTTGVDATMELGGRITGHVSEAASGGPLSGVHVCAYAEDEYASLYGTCVETEAYGDYTITGLAGGEWAVEFATRSGPLAPQFFKDAPSIEEASPVSVTAGATVEGVNAAMAGGGQISGTVTDAAGAPLEGAEVCVSPASEEPTTRGCADTGAGGAYTVPALASGHYLVAFHDFGKGYTSQYYSGVYWSVSATPVSVTAGANSAGVDAQLRAGGKVTGTVSDAATGHPLAGIEACMREIPPEGERPGVFPACALSGGSGEYAIAGLAPGEYEVRFTSPNRAFASQELSNKVIVAAEATDANVDAAMAPGGRISGRVTDETGASIQGAQVCAWATLSERRVGNCARTNAAGDYTITELEAANYEVHFEVFSRNASRNYATQYYSGASRASEASPVTVAAGGEATGINADMKTGGEITGRVTRTARGEPLEYVLVCAWGEAEGEARPSWCANTDANGEYTIVGLPSGSYQVRFMGGESTAPQYYASGYLAGEATPVAITAGLTRSGIDAALNAGGEIRGRVTAASDGKGVRGVTVCATLVGHEGEGAAGCSRSSISGDYTVTGLDPGSYVVEFSDTGRYRKVFYAGASSAAEATAVPVSLGAIAEGIDAAVLATSAGPLNTSKPVISGSPAVGSTLACANGTWAGEPPPTFAIRWLRDGAPISGATGAGYVVSSADQGQQLTCEVIATNSSGSTGATSSAVSIPTGGGEPGTPQSGHAPSGSGGLSGVSGYRATSTPSPVLAGVVSFRAGTLSVPLHCAATSGDCLQAVVTVSVVETVVGKRVTAVSAARSARRRSIKRVVVIGYAKVTIAAGRHDVLVRLNAAGRRLLQRWGKLEVLVEVRAQSSVLGSRIVRLRARGGAR